MVLSRFASVAGAAFLTVIATLPLAAQQASGPSPTMDLIRRDSTPIADRYRAVANRLIDAALADSAAWDRTARLTDTFGHRLSGSQALESALDWIPVSYTHLTLPTIYSV